MISLTAEQLAEQIDTFLLYIHQKLLLVFLCSNIKISNLSIHNFMISVYTIIKDTVKTLFIMYNKIKTDDDFRL